MRLHFKKYSHDIVYFQFKVVARIDDDVGDRVTFIAGVIWWEENKTKTKSILNQSRNTNGFSYKTSYVIIFVNMLWLNITYNNTILSENTINV